MNTLYELLRRSTNAACDLQNSDGSMPPGHNGLYNHEDTPVPNTARWLISYLKVYDEYGDENSKETSIKARDYLFTEEARPFQETFHCRKADSLDRCNGLMGQSLCIYSLSSIHEYLDDLEALSLAKEVFLKHPFDDELGVWKRVDIDGTILPFDPTFNHQLWFAAAGGLIQGSEEIDNQVKTFLDRLPYLMDTYQSGLIKHPLRLSGSVKYRLVNSKELDYLYLEKNTVLAPFHHFALQEKAIGYHSVNLYGLALLKSKYPDHPVWTKETIRSIFDYIYTEGYLESLYRNSRAFTNNATGFQNAYAIHEFGGSMGDVRAWVNEQVGLTFDDESGFMNIGANDPHSQASSIYTATVLPDIELTDSDNNIASRLTDRQ